MFVVRAWRGGEPRPMGDEHSELRWADLADAGTMDGLCGLLDQADGDGREPGFPVDVLGEGHLIAGIQSFLAVACKLSPENGSSFCSGERPPEETSMKCKPSDDYRLLE